MASVGETDWEGTGWVSERCRAGCSRGVGKPACSESSDDRHGGGVDVGRGLGGGGAQAGVSSRRDTEVSTTRTAVMKDDGRKDRERKG
eukprot:2789753-Rhodomonas_salina.1